MITQSPVVSDSQRKRDSLQRENTIQGEIVQGVKKKPMDTTAGKSEERFKDEEVIVEPHEQLGRAEASVSKSPRLDFDFFSDFLVIVSDH